MLNMIEYRIYQFLRKRFLAEINSENPSNCIKNDREYIGISARDKINETYAEWREKALKSLSE